MKGHCVVVTSCTVHFGAQRIFEHFEKNWQDRHVIAGEVTDLPHQSYLHCWASLLPNLHFLAREPMGQIEKVLAFFIVQGAREYFAYRIKRPFNRDVPDLLQYVTAGLHDPRRVRAGKAAAW